MTDRAMLTAAQAADLLGVRLTSIYAYVSRGVLTRELVVVDGRRHSMFPREQVVALAAERARPRAGLLDAVVESDVTQLDAAGHLTFRGRSLTELARLPFEQAANVVWQLDSTAPWPAVPDVLATQVIRSMPSWDDLPLLPDRVRLMLQLAAAHDVDRTDIADAHVIRVARDAIRLAVLALDPGHEPVPDAHSLASCYWRVLTGRVGSETEVAVINAAMVAMMDHELTASTLAARVAASTLADPWMSILTGLAAISGPRHGASSSYSERLLDAWIAERQLPEGTPPGFGHKVYEGIDPRAQLIFELIDEHDPALMADVDQLVTKVVSERSLLPNVDLGLAVLTRWARMRPGSAETIFMVCRIVGIAAHLIEEYPQGFRFRGRAVSGTPEA